MKTITPIIDVLTCFAASGELTNDTLWRMSDFAITSNGTLVVQLESEVAQDESTLAFSQKRKNY